MTAASAVRKRAARRFMAGPELHDALQREESLRGLGLKTAIGYWNAAGEDPDDVAAIYGAAVDALAERPDVHYSCKLAALDLDRTRIDELSERCRQGGVSLHYDSLGPELATSILEAGMATGAGVTLPGCWSRSPADAEKLAPTELRVRVIKGQWPDPEARRIDPRRGFIEVIERLAGRASVVEVATHDGPLAAEALQLLRRAGTPCELELLIGLPKAGSLTAAREAGVETRVYVPYGVPHLPYGIRGVLRHPTFVARLSAGLVRASTPAAF